jgi:8-oxo-dGTP pyrophosphatase MutT (NUDIX family)
MQDKMNNNTPENIEIFLENLALDLKSVLPGRSAQYKMAPELRLENYHGQYRNAAVMILLFTRNASWYTVLMRRPEYKGTHSNQISLPGGKFEESDADLEETALREVREEIGIDGKRIRLLGNLSRLHIPVSGIEVLPFVGFYPEAPDFQPDPSEVAYLVEVPLKDLLNPRNSREKFRTLMCKLVRVPYFKIGEEHIWGATAMILSEFLEVIRRGKSSFSL